MPARTHAALLVLASTSARFAIAATSRRDADVPLWKKQGATRTDPSADQPKVLNRLLVKAKSLDELLELYEEGSGYANAIHLTAFWKRVTQLTGGAGASEPSGRQDKELKWVGVKENRKRFKSVCERARDFLVSGNSDARAIVTTAAALAGAGLVTSAPCDIVWKHLPASLASVQAELSSMDLAASAYAFGLAKIDAPSLYETLVASTQNKLGDLKSWELANLAWSFGAANERAPELFVELADVLLPRAIELQMVELGKVAWGFATVDSKSGTHLFGTSEFVDRCSKLRDKFSTGQLAQLATWKAWRDTRGEDWPLPSPELLALIGDAPADGAPADGGASAGAKGGGAKGAQAAAESGGDDDADDEEEEEEDDLCKYEDYDDYRRRLRDMDDARSSTSDQIPPGWLQEPQYGNQPWTAPELADSERAWYELWSQRAMCWWQTKPAVQKRGLEKCAGALALHLARRFQMFLPRGSPSPLSADEVASIYPERGCGWIEWVDLPDFPDVLGDFNFEMPPLPNLTPWGVQKWQEMRERYEESQLTPMPEQEVRVEGGEYLTSTAVGAGAGIAAGALFAVGALLIVPRGRPALRARATGPSETRTERPAGISM